MKDKGNGMDLGTVVIIILLIFAVIAIIAAMVMIYGKATDIITSRYERRLEADRIYDVALINAAKVITVGRRAFVAR